LRSDRLALLVKAARMYHEERILQPEIADRLNVSQSRVSRLLKEAERMGIVRTVVITPQGYYSELEQGVRDALGLRDVVIAEAATDDEASILLAIGSAAAEYLGTTLKSGERIGISSRSASLLAMVEALAPLTSGRAESVVQTLGAVGNSVMQAQATRLTDRLAHLTGGTPTFLSAPGVVSSAAVRDGLLLDPHIAEAAAAWRDLTLVLTGVGSAKASPLKQAWGHALQQNDIDALAELDAVGDVCLNFFDRDGRPVDSGLRERVLGIGGAEFRAVPRRIAVAGGRTKVDAIRAAAAGEWINVVITDQHTARRLIG
jgi:DNA-binding transcriptional regulator LsrR (DeoR family)